MRTILTMSLTFGGALIVVAIASSILEIWATSRGAFSASTEVAEFAPAPLKVLTSGLMVRPPPKR